MKLNDLNKSNVAVKALKENFGFDFNPSKLDKAQTKSMLTKVVNLLKEARQSPDFYKNQQHANYMKLIFVAQSLQEHYKSLKPVKIVLENEEVEKSQVILAAQDMLNSVQKMIEEVNDMLVKELPALTDSIQSEIGVEQSAVFNQAATQSLTDLNTTLNSSKQTLQDAMNKITGVATADAFTVQPDQELAATDITAATEPSGEETLDIDSLDIEGPEDTEVAPTGGVGREKR